MAYNVIAGGFYVNNQTLIDNRMFFETLDERDNFDPARITSGIFTFVRETQRAYVSEVDLNGTIEWIPIKGYEFHTEINLVGGAEVIPIESEVHMMPDKPIVSIYQLLPIDGVQLYQEVELDYGFDESNDFYISSSESITVIVKMVSNG